VINRRKCNRAGKPAPGGDAPGASGLPPSFFDRRWRLSMQRCQQTDAGRARGFTLVELMVVMAMISVLAAFVFSGARGMMIQTNMTKCMSNMRQMGVAVQLFAGDHDGSLPGTSHGTAWEESLAAYLGPDFIGRCPGVSQHRARMTYGWNDCLATSGVGMKRGSCRTPRETMAVAELATDQSSEHFHFSGVRGGAARLTPNQFKTEVNVQAHGTSANYLFVDGHAENLEWTEVQRRLTTIDTTFIVP